MKYVIQGGQIVTMNPEREIIVGDILLDNGYIRAIGEFLYPPEAAVIPAHGELVIPGLIQTHVHLCQSVFRGLADDLELLDWLQLKIWPLEAQHTPESLYYAAALACGELLRGGTTTVLDMGTLNHTQEIFRVAELSGIRYIGGKCMMDYDPSCPLNETTEKSLQDSMDLLEKWHMQAAGRLQYAFCPRFVPSCTETLLRQVQRLSSHYDVILHTHAAENLAEIALVEKQRGRRNILYLNDLEICSPKTVLAHCIHLDEAEKNILASTRTQVAHCPSSNLKLASGIAPIPDLLERGITVSLGADGAPCNNNMDMFMEMRLSALIQKPLHGPTVMPAEQVFYLATLAGAEALGLEKEIGSLEIGKKADVVVMNLDSWHQWPHPENVYAQLVYQSRADDVDMVWVDGRLLVKNGEVLSLDRSEIKKYSSLALKDIMSRL